MSLLFPAVLSASPYDAPLEAMKAELNRSMKNLKLEDSPGPYFMAYRLTMIQTYMLQCTEGSIGWEYDLKRQVPFVEMRVGSYDLDNTWEGMATGQSLPGASLEMDTMTIRNVFWQLTDESYKNALAKYLGKKARLAEEMNTEKLPDFSKEKPQSSYELAEIVPDFDREQMKALCRKTSAEFKNYPAVEDSSVKIEYTSEIRLLINSEGSQLAYENRYTPYSIYVMGNARAPDGLLVDSFRVQRFRRKEDLPNPAELASWAKAVAEEVAALKEAPVQAPELAPAMLDGDSTGVFFHEALGHRLEGQRQRETGELQTFRNKLGTRIIPSFLNVYADPRMKTLKGVTLSGHYDFDSDGVPAQRVPLVEKGILKNFMMSRRPAAKFIHSNSSGRSDEDSLAEGRMSVLVIESNEPMKRDELKQRLLEEIKKKGKPFGFRMVAMRSGEAQTTRGGSQSFVSRPRLIYRVEADGKETLVRGLEYVGTPLSAIEKIVAAGDDLTPSNGFCGSTSGWVAVTEIGPSVVLSELELQRQPENRFRPPILKSPLFEDKP